MIPYNEKKYIHDLRLKLIDFLIENIDNLSVDQIIEKVRDFYHIYSNRTVHLGNCNVYRVRKIEDDEPHDISSKVWCPTSDRVKLGRANDIGNPMFYGALDPHTAIKEVKITPEDEFSLAVYRLATHENNRESSILINEVLYISNNPTETELFGKELSNFMVKMFTENVPDGEEHKYAKTCAISKILLELPQKDSLIYPSMQNKDAINIVMKEPDARERLTLINVMTCTINVNGTITIKAIKKLLPDGITLHEEEHDYLPCPLEMRGEPFLFSILFPPDLRSQEEIFEDMLRKAREVSVE